MSNWLDNLVAQQGGLIEEEEEEDNAPVVVKGLAVQEKEESKPEKQQPETVEKKEQIVEEKKEAVEEREMEYSGKITKEMYHFNNSANELLKRQESAYCKSMLQTRKNLDKVINKTSLPIQAIGGLGKISNEAKCKYSDIEKKIMEIQPISLKA